MADFPKFPAFRPIELSDREPVEAIFRAMRPEVSELCFTNLFMFKHVHDYKISTLNGNLLFYAKSYQGEYYFFPPVGDNKIPETINMPDGLHAGERRVARGQPGISGIHQKIYRGEQ